jgi:hypothetical protein
MMSFHGNYLGRLSLPLGSSCRASNRRTGSIENWHWRELDRLPA